MWLCKWPALRNLPDTLSFGISALRHGTLAHSVTKGLREEQRQHNTKDIQRAEHGPGRKGGYPALRQDRLFQIECFETRFECDMYDFEGANFARYHAMGSGREQWAGSSSSPEWEQDLSQNGPQNAQQLMQARFIQQQQAMMREKMQNGQLPGMQMGQQRMTDANIGMPNGAARITREGGQQAQLEQRMAMQTQQQVSMLGTKLFQGNLATWLQQQQLTQETCPPDLLQKFKMQCLGSARQKIMQLRQHQQHQQLQASLMQQKQHMGGQMSPRRIPSM
ncbi:hypothetical protein LA080_003849 [Diaporthe eres]|nr:hypothetical protein LA080_003849 [Diaporthe eres]